MTPEMTKLLIFAATFAAGTLLTFLALRSRAEKAAVRSGLEETLLLTVGSEMRSVALTTPFGQRVVGPSVKKLAQAVVRWGPKGIATKARERLIVAGLAEKISVDTYLAAILGLPMALFALFLALDSVGSVPGIAWLGVVLAAFVPKMWLTGKVEARQKAILAALPDTLDLLTISVEAGLGFDAALARVVNVMPGPLSDELYRMLSELRIGIPRVQSLKRLSERTQVRDLDEFITAISQADTFGIAVGKVLRVQSHQLRQKRSQAAEERAAKTPVKLLFPLLVCVFPAIFVVLVGPSAIRIVEAFVGI